MLSDLPFLLQCLQHTSKSCEVCISQIAQSARPMIGRILKKIMYPALLHSDKTCLMCKCSPIDGIIHYSKQKQQTPSYLCDNCFDTFHEQYGSNKMAQTASMSETFRDQSFLAFLSIQTKLNFNTFSDSLPSPLKLQIQLIGAPNLYYPNLNDTFYQNSNLHNHHECWITKNGKYMIAFDEYAIQWKIGTIQSDGTIANGLSSLSGYQTWPHMIANTWKFFDSMQHEWSAANDHDRIVVNEGKSHCLYWNLYNITLYL